MPLASQNYRSGQPISEYIQHNLAPHFSPDLINPQHFCHSARRKPVRLSKSGLRNALISSLRSEMWRLARLTFRRGPANGSIGFRSWLVGTTRIARGGGGGKSGAFSPP